MKGEWKKGEWKKGEWKKGESLVLTTPTNRPSSFIP